MLCCRAIPPLYLHQHLEIPSWNGARYVFSKESTKYNERKRKAFYRVSIIKSIDRLRRSAFNFSNGDKPFRLRGFDIDGIFCRWNTAKPLIIQKRQERRKKNNKRIHRQVTRCTRRMVQTEWYCAWRAATSDTPSESWSSRAAKKYCFDFCLRIYFTYPFKCDAFMCIEYRSFSRNIV